MKNRKSNIEVVRIFAMCLIILYHNWRYGGWSFEGITTNKIIVDALSMGGKLGVNLFACISGYFFIKNWSVKKVIKIELQTLFISWVCLVIYILTVPLTVRELIQCCIKNMMPVIFNQYWFVSAYIMLLFLEPFINVFVFKLSKRQIELFLTIMIVLWSIIPTITAQTKDPFGYNQYIWLIVMYILGAYIKKYEEYIWSVDTKMLAYVCGGGGGGILIILFMLPVFCEYLRKNDILIFINYKNLKACNSIIVVMATILLFLIFSRIKIKYNPIINRLGSAAFSVYLVHENVLLKNFVWQKFLNVKSFQESEWLILFLLFCVIIIYLMGFIIDIAYELIYKIFFDKKIDVLANFCNGKLSKIWSEDDTDFSNGC